MTESDTLEKKIDILLKTKEIMQKEALFDVQFYAFLNGLMHLKMNNLQDAVTQAIDRWNQGLLVNNAGGDIAAGPTPPMPPQPETEEQRKAMEQAEAKRKEEEAKAAIAA